MAGVLAFCGLAQACPNCATARVVRASVFDEKFWTHLMLITLPLLVLALVSFLLYRIGLEQRTAANTQRGIDLGRLRPTHTTEEAHR
jgi:hypothetical protein